MRAEVFRFLAPALIIFMASHAGLAQQIHYEYDIAGRLVFVNYGSGTGIRYIYDRAGNLLSRSVGFAPQWPRLTGLSARGGQVGTVLTISGTSLETVSEVRFGSVTATVINKTATRIDVIVPAGATTGNVTVTTAGGSASSTDVFAIAPAVTETRLSIQTGGVVSTSTIGPYVPLRAGYATGSLLSGPAPYGTAIVSFTQGGVIVSEVGVPTAPPTTSARIFIEHRPNLPSRGGTLNIATGFAVVNTGSAQAAINLRLRDAQGATLAAGAIRLAANAHLARFLHELAPDFILPADFSNIGFGSLDLTSDQPLSILALRLTTSQRGDLLLTSTPMADLTRPAPSGAQVLPHVADGGGYEMTLTLLNTSASSETGVVRFADSSGQPLAVRVAGSADPLSEVPYTIPSGGHLRIATDGSPPSVKTGWAQIVPAQGPAPVAAGVFSFSQGNNLVTESGVPAASRTTRALVYVDKSKGHDTGVAVVNPGTAVQRITFRVFQSDGRTAAGSGSATVDLQPGGHIARFAGELVSGLPDGFVGVLEISSPAEFAALTLRSLTNPRGDYLLTTFPVADTTRPAPAPLIFPQIADGGNYQTEFILLSPSGQPTTLDLRFLGDNGAPIDVGRTNP